MHIFLKIPIDRIHPQNINLDEKAGLQSEIDTIHTRRQISAPHLTFCGQYVIVDIQDCYSYTPFHKNKVLIK
jgi:hypothetical protein